MTTKQFISAAISIALFVSCSAGGAATPDAPGAPRVDAPVADAPPATDAPATDALAADGSPDSAPPDATPPDAPPDGPVVLALTLVGTTPTAYAGHTASAGSTFASDLCPAQAVLTGLRGRLRGTDLYNGPIWGACTPIVLLDAPLAITTGSPTTDLPEHGSVQTGDTTWARDCPAGEVVVSVSGRAGAIIDQLVVQCAPLVVGPSAPYPVTTGAITALPLAGDSGGGSPFSPPSCPAGQIANGLLTYFEGDPGFGLPTIYLDGFALVCTAATVQ